MVALTLSDIRPHHTILDTCKYPKVMLVTVSLDNTFSDITRHVVVKLSDIS